VASGDEGSHSRLRLGRITGEFTLIVVGVLVALAADGWMERLRDKGLERQYLSALRDALQADTAALASGIRFSSTRSASVNTVLEVLDGSERSGAAEFLLSVHIGGQFVIPATETAVFEELLSSGRFLLLEDVDLRRQLLAYYRGVDHPVNQRWQNTIWYRYRPVVSRVLSPSVQAWAGGVLYEGLNREATPFESAAEFERTRTLLSQEAGIAGLLQEVAAAGNAQVDVWTLRLERATELLGMIENYLD
jgi:hypothetical protein